MAITLNGVTLSPELLWTDEFAYTQVAQNEVRTLGGKLKIYSQGLEKGRPITLEGVQNQGWLTKTQVLAVKALADTAGGIYTLVIGSQTFSVMFRHEGGLPFTAEPLISRIDANAEDYFTCVLNLITV